MRLEHHLVGGYVRYISPYIIIIIVPDFFILPLRKNLLGLKRNANNHYFAFTLQVLQVGKQFATANSLFIFAKQYKTDYQPKWTHFVWKFGW